MQQPTPSNADQLLAKRRQQAKAGNDGKIAELIHARQGLQTDLGELEHGYARVGHTSRAADAVRLHKLGQRGNTLTGEASAAAVQYAEKLQLLKDAKIREMRLVIAKAEEKEGLKELDRKHLLDRQKRGVRSRRTHHYPTAGILLTCVCTRVDPDFGRLPIPVFNSHQGLLSGSVASYLIIVIADYC